jgi:hypothetical protein
MCSTDGSSRSLFVEILFGGENGVWMMSNADDNRQKTVMTPKQTSSHSFRRAFAFGAVWWIVVSLVATANNRARSPGFIFGEMLSPSLIAGAVAGTAGHLIRVRSVWLLIGAVFLLVWFAVRLAVVVVGPTLK